MSLNNTVTQARHAIWQECLIALRRELEVKNTRGLIIMPPRFGEELIAAQLAAHLFAMGAHRLLCLTEHRVSLQYVEQALRAQLGSEYSLAVFQDNKATEAQVVLSTYRAMENHLDGDGPLHFKPDTFDGVICFDCDRSGAEKFRQVVEFFAPRFMRLGITPTAWRHDGTTIHDLFGETTYAVSLGEAQKRGAMVVDYQNVLDRLQEEGVLVRPTGTAYAQRVNNRRSVIPNRDVIIAQTIHQIIAELSAKKALVVVPNTQSCELMEALLGKHAVALYDKASDKGLRRQLMSEEQFIAIVAHTTAPLEPIEFDVVFLLHNTEQFGGVLRQIALGISREVDDKPLVVRDLVGSYEGLVNADRRPKTQEVSSAAVRPRRSASQGSEILDIEPEAFQFRSYPVDLAALEKSQRGFVQTYTLRGKISIGEFSGACRMYRFTTEAGLTEDDCNRIAKTLGRLEAVESLLCYVSIKRDEVYAVVVFVWMVKGEEAGLRDERRLWSVFRRMGWLSKLERLAYPSELAGDDLDMVFEYLRIVQAELPSDRATGMRLIVDTCLERKQVMFAEQDTAEFYGWEGSTETLFKIVFGVTEADLDAVYQALQRDLKPLGFTAFRDDNDDMLASAGPGQLVRIRDQVSDILKPFNINFVSVEMSDAAANQLRQKFKEGLLEQAATDPRLSSPSGPFLLANAVAFHYWYSQDRKDDREGPDIPSDLLYVHPYLSGEALLKVRAILDKLREGTPAASLKGEEDAMLFVVEAGKLDSFMEDIIRSLNAVGVDYREKPLPDEEAQQLWQATLGIAKDKVGLARPSKKPAGTLYMYNLRGTRYVGNALYETMVLRFSAHPTFTSAAADLLCLRLGDFTSETTRAYGLAVHQDNTNEVLVFLLCRGTTADLRASYAQLAELFKKSGFVSSVQELRYFSHILARQDLTKIAEHLASGDNEMQSIARLYVQPCLEDDQLWQK